MFRYARAIGAAMFVVFFVVGLLVYYGGGDINRLFLVAGLWIVSVIWVFVVLIGGDE
jgi:hypothetical protein